MASDELKELRDRIRDLERQLSLTRLQVNRLLNITEAINNNVKEQELFAMYAQFLNWELNVGRMMLVVRDKQEETEWRCAIAQPVTDYPTWEKLRFDTEELAKYDRTELLDPDETAPELQSFEAVIPVTHKRTPIAYAFIGGYDKSDPGKVQIIIMLTNVISVAIENKRLVKKQIAREYEMKLAKDMQLNLIPDVLPQSPRIDMATFYQPHFEVGGDFLDVIQVDETRFLFSVADIAGKGLAAAMLMANFEAAFRVLVERTHSNDEFIQALNHAVNRITKGDSYITFFVAQFNTEKNKLKYVNAGHVAPILILNPNAPIEERKLVFLDKRCAILGFFKQLPKVNVVEMILETDALLCIFTDGVTEVGSENGLFGEERMADFALKNAHLSAEDFNQQLLKTLEDFSSDMDFPDDITILTTKLKVENS